MNNDKLKKMTNFIMLEVQIMITTVIGVGILYYISNVMGNSIIWNIPSEVRDISYLRMSHMFSDGINPYVLENVNRFNTPIASLYPFLLSFITGVVSKALGISVLQAAYFVNITLWILSSLIIYRIIMSFLDEKNTSIVVGMLTYSLALCATMFTLFGTVIFVFRTGGLGIFLFLLVILCVRKDDSKVYLISILFVLLFFANQNMGMMVVPMVIYYFLFNRKFFFKFLIVYTSIFILAFVLSYLSMPLHTVETIIILFDTVKSILTWRMFWDNLIMFASRYIVLIVVGIVYFFVTRNSISKENKRFIGYLLINSAMALVLLLYFGRNGDDGYKYFQQMLAPNIVIAVPVFGVLWVSAEKNKSTNIAILILSMYVIVAQSLFSFWFMRYSKDDIGNYSYIEKMLDQYESDDVFLGMTSGFYVMGHENVLVDGYYDDGHIEYFNIQKNQYDGSNIDQLEYLISSYANVVNRKIKNKEFKCICGDSDMIDKQLLEENYYLSEEIPLKTSNDIMINRIYYPR